jgi:pimeloyl-ACP methyl ester carboxylesterase
MAAHRSGREQTRARYPDREGLVARDGVRIHYEEYGSGEPAILLLPSWSIGHSRIWKAQIPFLARQARVITFDPRGNGRSDRPQDPDSYTEQEFAADALAVLDELGVDRTYVVGHSMGAQRALLLAGEHPERIAGAMFIAPAVPLGVQTARAGAIAEFDVEQPTYDGWSKYNRHFWLEHYEEFLEFFMTNIFVEPHSTKQIEDTVSYGLDTDPDTLVATAVARGLDEADVRRLVALVRCPTVVIHGSADEIRTPESGRMFADLLGSPFILLEGCGHAPQARDPVRVNLLIRDFLRATASAAASTRPAVGCP